MDIFDEEIIKLFAALNDNNVLYIVVGGLAINLHGYDRFTGDVDVWLKDTSANRKNLRQAFVDCDMPDYPMLETMQFVPGWTDFHLNNSVRLDIMTDMKGIDNYSFDECLEMAATAELEDTIIPFLHISQLIDNKKAVDRPKDQLDVIALKRIQEMREQETDLENNIDNDHDEDRSYKGRKR
ncbi:hypothetical protein FO440_18395 [Mucilaginibacter corticis]|uniref:Nucleotidyltransferase family protein n=1 Tax=Mucilaginibacter corticis TaxID=2597670 RepID=A0A556MIM3_9SPHI|nr:nucleotidyltransferase [Mucilaginibacter corticis]TSJ39709.1 hypothetical protein FO440_18395 [Mucilaginibacter corticis]